MNVSSIVVKTMPDFMADVKKGLLECGVCELHYEDERGICIVVIEGENVDEELAKLRVIQAVPHVVSAEMMFSYAEDEIAQNMEQLKNGDVIPKMLKEELPAQAVKYGGDVRNFVE